MGMRQTETVDIVELTPNEVVAKVNAATVQITRNDAVDAQTVSGWNNFFYLLHKQPYDH
jgi:hypothetical protein